MEGLYDNFMDWIGWGNKPAEPVPDGVVEAIRQFPVRAAQVAKVQERASALRAAIQGAANVPFTLKFQVGSATIAANKAAESLLKYREELKKAIIKARANGTLSSAEEASLKSSGLGYLGAFPGFNSSGVAASRSLPFVLVSSPTVAARAARAARGVANPKGGQTQLGALGVIPLAIIGVGVALTLAAAAVAGAIVVSYRATSEDVARADAIVKTAEAGISEWKAQGGKINDIPAIPGQSTTSTVAGAALSIGTLALVGVGLYLILRKKAA